MTEEQTDHDQIDQTYEQIKNFYDLQINNAGGYELLPDAVYRTVFVEDPTGKKILFELLKLYYDELSFTIDNQYMTAYNEGRRSVVKEILNRIGNGYNNNNKEENE